MELDQAFYSGALCANDDRSKETKIHPRLVTGMTSYHMFFSCMITRSADGSRLNDSDQNLCDLS
jgi:hypothetical protein